MSEFLLSEVKQIEERKAQTLYNYDKYIKDDSEYYKTLSPKEKKQYNNDIANKRLRRGLIHLEYNYDIEITPNEEISGWDITEDECHRISMGERSAVDRFFFTNIKRLRLLAYKVICRNAAFKTLLTADDCLNQLYLDLLSGYLCFEYKPFVISRLIAHSYRYAIVGGFGAEDGQYKREA